MESDADMMNHFVPAVFINNTTTVLVESRE